MNDVTKIATLVPRALAAFAETDLSLVEMAAVFRLAAEACQQGQILQEVAIAMARNRAGPSR